MPYVIHLIVAANALFHPYTFLAASVVLSAAAVLAVLDQPHSNLFTIPHPFRPGLLIAAAFALSSLCLRKSRRLDRMAGYVSVSYIAFYLALIQFVVLTSYIGFALSRPIVNPVREIELAAMGLCVLAIALAIVASWVGHWVFFEPVAVGLMALALGAICVPGLRLFTKPFTYPNVNGAALLFATGSSDQALSLDVTVLPPDQEKFTINNTQGHRQTHWVLLITGDAQLHSRTAPRSVYHDDTYKNTQLFWGIINPKSDITVSGIARRDFHLTTHARAAVSFPEYGEGHLDQIHPDMRPIILERLSGKLAARQDNFTVNVRAGRLGPFLSVTQSTPELVQGAMAEYRLAWTGHDDISITFSLTNQAGVDDTNNALFVFAVLLGVAGACLIESLLGAIKRTAKTKASK